MSYKIYFSPLLQTIPAYRPDAAKLFAALDAAGVPYQLLEGTRDIWLRDFMPVQTRTGRLVSFRYDPSYLRKEPQLRTNFRRDMDLGLPYICSDINLDGGNVVFSPSRKRAIVSRRIVAENPGFEPEELQRELSDLLEAEIILIPDLKSDMTGHADGMVRFLDEETVLCNAPLSPHGIEQRIREVLQKCGLQTLDFPFAPAARGSAVGCYLNYLETPGAIFLPVFGIEEDTQAIAAAEQIFCRPVVPVLIPGIAAQGGCLNCISWDRFDCDEIPMSQEEYLRSTPEYKSGQFHIVSCPVCGRPTLDMYWICQCCGWEYDPVLQNEEEESPGNGMSLREYRRRYASGL